MWRCKYSSSGMRCLSRSRFSAMGLFSPPESRVGGSRRLPRQGWWAAPVFSNSQRPEACEKRVSRQWRSGVNRSERPPPAKSNAGQRPAQKGKRRPRRSRLRNHRRRVEGSATRSGSLTVGAASSQHGSRKCCCRPAASDEAVMPYGRENGGRKVKVLPQRLQRPRRILSNRGAHREPVCAGAHDRRWNPAHKSGIGAE